MWHNVLALVANAILGTGAFFAIYKFLELFEWWSVVIIGGLVVASYLEEKRSEYHGKKT